MISSIALACVCDRLTVDAAMNGSLRCDDYS